MNELKMKRANIKGLLTRFANSLIPPYDIPNLLVRLEKADSLLEKYNEVQAQIEFQVSTDEHETSLQEKESESFETAYFNAITKAREIINHNGGETTTRGSRTSENNSNEDNNESNKNNMNIRKLDVPVFDGDYEGWIPFRDSFLSMVGNNKSFSAIEKFHFLNQSVTKDAKRAIAAFTLTADNYSAAWETLKSRYEDENELIHHHVSGLFEASPVKNNSHAELRLLLDTINNHLQSLKTLKEPTDSWDTLIIHLIKLKLNEDIKLEWEKTIAVKTERATLKDIQEFLEKHCKFLYKTGKRVHTTQKRGIKPIYSSGINNNQLKTFTANVKSCIICKGEHALFACEEFKKLPTSMRLQRVRENKLCFNCLGNNHQNVKCKSGPCRKCGRKHNTLLHLDKTTELSSAPTSHQDKPKESSENEQRNFSVQSSQDHVSYVMLATARIYVHDKFGNKHDCRILLDQGSQPHIMTTELCQRLGLPCKQVGITLSGIEQGSQNVPFQITAKISSRVTDFTTTVTCLVLNKISDDIPAQKIELSSIKIPNGIELADPSFDQSQPIDMLIGAALFYELLCVGQIKLKESGPYFQKTLLGWIVGGNMQLPSQRSRNKVVCNLIKNSDLSMQLEKFWKIEHSLSDSRSQLIKNDPAELHFNKTTERDESGRFIVSIPFKDKLGQLGTSKDMAYKRLISMEKKFDKDPLLKEQYVNFMTEYEELGHMSVAATRSEDSIPHFYLPHHAVKKEDSTTTKLRVVFDGSAKTTTGISLNDAQYVGTPVQNELLSILLRFRQHRYVISADVTKMYRQILIKKEERAMQRILWRSDNSAPIKMYELNTVTYGTASAPFLATRCLHELGLQNTNQFPTASNVILQDFYVDDLLSGSQTIMEAKQLKTELNSILGAAGLELRKWASNDLRIIERTDRGDNLDIPIYGEKDPKTLGLMWDPQTDVLKYRVKTSDSRKVTKRTILSIIAQIFDPLGLVGPAIIQAKVLLQRLWTLKLDWDESLPQDVHTAWIKIYKDITNINEIIIPRYVLSTDYKQLEFHGFCDASEIAYGASIYICSVAEDGTRKTHLLCAKSRVAPLQATSIPRLELLGALLLAQLSNKISTACKIKKNQWYFWSDSTIALAWIKSPSTRWKTFVANRTAEIQELTNERWNHVGSAQNPADLISRGVSTTDLRESTLWWFGPSWLSLNETEWPPSAKEDSHEPPEQRKVLHAFIANQINNERQNEVYINRSSESFYEKISSFTRIIRTTAFIFRFINNCKFKINMRKPNTSFFNSDSLQFLSKYDPLTTTELEFARNRVIKFAQSQSFPKEISILQKNIIEFQLKGSSLNQLKPFLDKSGLLRVGGRLENAQIAFDQKHPIILAAQHKFTRLLIKYEHERLLHAGCQTVIMSLRRNYWPITGKNIVKKILRDCIKCFKVKPIETKYTMADLPSVRVTPARAFYNSGVDYAGPILIKEKGRGRTQIKSYICIFVCMVTKAIHIELASDLSTDTFLNCLKRFISRRGICRNIYSDNATNFVGANNEILELKRVLTDKNFQNEITNFLSNLSINWHFIPPNAPNFGGLWESAVKSAKYHLKRVIGETRLTYEELYTVLTQVESCLNSRPLSPLSNDPNDLTPLTPGHFLIGDSLTALPQADLRIINAHRLDRYQHLQQMLQHFWDRWQKEYLTTLQVRPKTKGFTSSTIKPGMMVLIKEDNVPPMHWSLGRITELHPGKDGIARVATIRIAKGYIKRALSKICMLPIATKSESNSTEGIYSRQLQQSVVQKV